MNMSKLASKLNSYIAQPGIAMEEYFRRFVLVHSVAHSTVPIQFQSSK